MPGAVTWRYYDKTHTVGNYRDPETMGYTHDTTPLDGSLGYIGCDHLDQKNICFKDVEPAQNVYSEQNLLNEYSRPYGAMNMWISDKVGASLTLKADQPQDVEEIHLVFDTSLEYDNYKQMESVLVKDYDLEIETETGTKVHQVRENYLRLNKFKIAQKGVNGIKIDILAMHQNGKSASMYAIKIE